MPLLALALAGVLAASPSTLARISDGNALTLPAQRHVVRVDPGDGAAIWLLALQQGGVDGHGLVFYRSDDEGQTWSLADPIQNDATHTDRADLLVVGRDVALVYSYEGPDFTGSTRHDVFFQWWRYVPETRGFQPEPAVRVFDSTSSSTGYARGQLARDSLGRLWVMAFSLESGGGSRVVLSVSTDGGHTFAAQPDLASLPRRGGGRLLHLGQRLIALWGMHDSGGTASRFRLHEDAAAPGSWGPSTQAFPEAIYHGAALSAVATPEGGMHLVYKDESEVLLHRYFDGTSFGPRTVLFAGEWAAQPAITRVGSRLVICTNRALTDTSFRLEERVLESGVLSAPVLLDGSATWKGYPAAVEVLPAGVAVPCVYSNTANAGVGGNELYAFSDALAPEVDGGTPDAGSPDAGSPDAGMPDAGAGDAGAPPPPPAGTLLLSDDFGRNAASLGSAWTQVSGVYFTDGRAASDRDSGNQAYANGATCRDCRVEATVLGFGVPETGLFLRAPALRPDDRYDAVLLGDGRVQVHRHRAGLVTVLGSAASGLAALDTPAKLSLSAVGSAPVSLVLAVNGVPRVSTEDTGPSALVEAGYGGLWTNRAGVVFDAFRLWIEGTSGTPDAGVPDAGVPDAGVPDAGASDAGVPDAGLPDAGVPDAGTPDAGLPDAGAPDAGPPDAGVPDAGAPDAGAPDAGSSDAGVPDAGLPDAGAPDAGLPDAGAPDAGTPDAGAPGPGGVLFSDDFTRTSLGTSWQAVRGLWFLYRNNVASDLDGADQLAALGASCRDCEVQALVTSFGVSEAGVYLRSPTAGATGDRYDLVLRSDNSVQIRRFRGGTSTVLGTASSGLASASTGGTLKLSASGSGPVQLTASVNGSVRLQVTDSSSSALGTAGYAGLWTLRAGVVFDDFVLTSLGGAPPPTDGGVPDAGTPDAGVPDAGSPDAGTSPDAGVPDAGTGTRLTLSVTLTETRFNFLGVDGSGTAYATRFGESESRLYASTDNARTWTLRGTHPNGSSFKELAVLSNGTLIADTQRSSSHWLSRSTDGGRTWSEVLSAGVYRMLTPHSIAELDGTVYWAEYQTFTGEATPIRVWASTDNGATWSVRATLNGHRHAHGLRADPARSALWIYFGDTTPQGATLRSTDAGRTWTTLLTGQEGIIVDAEVLPNGDLIFGQDISFLPERPAIGRLSPTGVYTVLAQLPGPSYSGHTVRSGGFVIGATREPGGDIYPPGAENAYLYGSLDGVTWEPLLSYRRLNTVDNARMDVYWELPTGELVLELENVQPANGYQLLRPGRR
ncbi:MULTISPECIES: sialidase family protein [Myxococcaceae]|uniref:sialidase family protein n=1 Tax=Myxococcaceae TaxID=31 RepID=UPI001E34FB1E|nr:MULTISPECIES: sialidase family protein [Myxococcaceae]